MKVTVNGEQTNTESKTLLDLIRSYDIEQGEKGTAVAVNDTVVPKDQWKEYQITEGDNIEIIRATQGG